MRRLITALIALLTAFSYSNNEIIIESSSKDIVDFYSEGDYWWPDPQNPDGPYIRRDGMTNPENQEVLRNLPIRNPLLWI